MKIEILKTDSTGAYIYANNELIARIRYTDNGKSFISMLENKFNAKKIDSEPDQQKQDITQGKLF